MALTVSFRFVQKIGHRDMQCLSKLSDVVFSGEAYRVAHTYKGIFRRCRSSGQAPFEIGSLPNEASLIFLQMS